MAALFALGAAAVAATAFLTGVYGTPALSLLAMCTNGFGGMFWAQAVAGPALQYGVLVAMQVLVWGDRGQTVFAIGNLSRYGSSFGFILTLAGAFGVVRRNAALATLQWMRGVPFYGNDMALLGNSLLAANVLFFGPNR